LAEALKPAGYATACVGKWHLGHQPGMLPTRRGFDRYFGIPYSNDMSRATAGNPGFLRELDKHPETPGTPLIRDEEVIETEPDQRLLTRRYTEESIRFLGECARAERRFFLYLAHTMPHHPLFASERFLGRSRRGLYGDVVEELDWSVGEIRAALRSLGLAESTLVLFVSDNGPWLVKGVEGGSAGLLREGKGTTWEGGMRVPFLACWPGRTPAGIVSAAFVSAMDVFPTLLALAGVPLPDRREFDGTDISPVLFGERSDREALLFYYAGRKLCAVRKGPWKLHVSANEGALASPLLFHLDEDPSEKHDLAARNPAVVTELRDLIARHRGSLSPGPPQM
jgi:arylsulfatase A-like enzyme